MTSARREATEAAAALERATGTSDPTGKLRGLLAGVVALLEGQPSAVALEAARTTAREALDVATAFATVVRS